MNSQIQFLATDATECKNLEEIIAAFSLDTLNCDCKIIVRTGNPYDYFSGTSIFCEEFAEASVCPNKDNSETDIRFSEFTGHIYVDPIKSVVVVQTSDRKYGLAIVHKTN